MKLRSTLLAAGAAASLLLVPASGGAATGSPVSSGVASGAGSHASSAVTAARHVRSAQRLPGGYQHLVVIYEENHSFDNLYGHWGRVGGKRVDGLRRATRQARTQVAQDGTRYRCLLQNDVNLASPPLSARCQDSHSVTAADGTTQSGFASHFRNRPFSIDRYIHPADTTCPAPGVSAPHGVLKGQGLPGGCTEDLVHRFYQNQYQINGGRSNRYVTGSDAVGLTMGHYRTRTLPVYRYLHSRGAPKYVVADRFFQAAFGGSFLNHQWLIAARSPLDTSHGSLGATSTVVDANGMPTAYPLYTPTSTVNDGQLTQKCADPAVMDPRRACGDFAVNTVQPSSPPASASGAKIPLIDDTRYPNIGDRLTAAGLSWNWYSGGWADAEAGHPGPLFQYHHQPFNYFAAYAPGTPGRRHLKDESRFLRAARTGHLPAVSFVKPYGAENEHPGYASEPNGSDHLVDLLKAVTEGPQARSTLVVVTYDEFGGQWDHVAPPGTGHTRGVHDAWGPGTRIPALVLSRSLRHSSVDHTVYDTTSILATIERSYGLRPLSSRDAHVHDLSAAVRAGGSRRR